MDELANPYRPGAGTTPPALIGRDELIRRFDITLARAREGRPGKSIMTVGLRGVGKTVLLNRFASLAEGRGYLVAFVEASDSGDFGTLLSVNLRKVLFELDRGSDVEGCHERLCRFSRASLSSFPTDQAFSSIRIRSAAKRIRATSMRI